MRIDVVTLFPELVRPVAEAGVVGRAVSDGKMSLNTWNPRDYATDRHRTVDDRPYGGGPGMVMGIEPLRSAIRAAREAADGPVRTSLMSPQGRVLDQAAMREMASRDRLLLVCGRYEGIDQRLIDSEVDEQWSLGDYVLSGGELAAAVIIDATGRLLPGVLGHSESAQQDSFSEGLLDCPHYTRPETSDGVTVPAVLLSGDHAAIARWRRQQALGNTWRQRPELLEEEQLSDDDRRLLDEYRQGIGKNDKAAG